VPRICYYYTCFIDFEDSQQRFIDVAPIQLILQAWQISVISRKKAKQGHAAGFLSASNLDFLSIRNLFPALNALVNSKTQKILVQAISYALLGPAKEMGAQMQLFSKKLRICNLLTIIINAPRFNTDSI